MSKHPQEVLLAQFSLYLHKCGLKNPIYFIYNVQMLSFPDFYHPCVWAYVGLHELSRALRVRENERGGREDGEGETRTVRFPHGIYHQRLYEPAPPLWHHEGGKQPGLKGLWHWYPAGIGT